MQAHHTDTFRESVISVLGAPPDPAPLLPQVLDVVVENGYRREHIKFQVGLGDWSYAYLLIPLNLGAAAPVVYCHHREGNYRTGKAEIVGLEGDKDQALGLELVKRGYIVFAPDAVGYGERRPVIENPANTFEGAYGFQQLSLRLLRGETLLKKVLWDISSGIDYLETRSEVDSRFVGFVGYGYGGTMALWTAAMDSRITAAAAHSGIMTYREHIRRGDWFPAEFVVPRLMQVADLHHILSLVSPRPFLLSTSNDAENNDASEIYEKALAVYQKQGAANRLTLYCYTPLSPNGTDPGELAVGVTKPLVDPAIAAAIKTARANAFESHMRYNLYNWLDSWLLPF